MPEFHLNKPTASHAYDSLDDFAKGYVEAMFFTNGDTGDSNEDLLNDLGVERLTKASVKAIARDCSAFLGTIMPDGCFARQWVNRLTMEDEQRDGIERPQPRYGDGCNDDRRAGHFFWYARQGHGVAWTDDYAPDESAYAVADGLQEASRKQGECYVDAYRGWIRIS